MNTTVVPKDSGLIVPVTQGQMTKEEIGSSRKIAQTILTSKLRTRLHELTAIRSNAMDAVRKQIQVLEEVATKDVTEQLSSDEDLTALRKSLNKLTGKAVYKANKDLFDEVRVTLTNTKPYSEEEMYLRKVLKKGSYKVELDLRVSWYYGEDSHGEGDCRFIVVNVAISQAVRTAIFNYIEKVKEFLEAHKNLDVANSKFRDMEETLDTLEAQILIQELRSTDRGQATLNATQSLIADFLGDNPRDLLPGLSEL